MPNITPEFLGYFSMAVGLAAYVPYFHGLLTGKAKPHAFSWLVWGLLTGIAFFAQIVGGAGPGAWATGLTAVMCLTVVVFALFKGEKKITRSDWISFIAALAAIPVWLITDNPLYSVILITVIDGLGFYPTFRKSWHRPQDEVSITYGLSALKFAVSLLALETMSWTTALYPASLVIMNGAFVIMILWRRGRKA